MITAHSKFKIIPTLAILEALILPEPKTIVFGGVATGNIKAHEAESVTANKVADASQLKAMTNGARIGRIN